MTMELLVTFLKNSDIPQNYAGHALLSEGPNDSEKG